MADKVTIRREAKTASIVAEAWELAREHGVGGVSLHALARAVGMRQPSLYEYFDSKHALYDAMFADGNRQLLERLAALKLRRRSPDRPEEVPGHVRRFRASRTRPDMSFSSSGTSRVSRPRPSRTPWPRTYSGESSSCCTKPE